PGRWIAEAERGVLPELAERLGHAHGHGGLALAGGRRVDARDQHEPALRLAVRQGVEPDLRLVLAVQLDVVVAEPELGGDLGDRTELRGLRDRDVGGDLGGGRHESAAPNSGAASRAPNTRRALSVVRCAMSAREAPRARPRASATAGTNAGSFRLPRCGTGAR